MKWRFLRVFDAVEGRHDSLLTWVIIGGLISSTLLSRLVTPVMYELLAPSLEEIKWAQIRLAMSLGMLTKTCHF
ncbi:MAG: efflux RND transporter permease subunit [Deltaproteobacteria bacterium]|nr:efflux RND transporter permease subunit [Deltaproteobacteria bacterium]